MRASIFGTDGIRSRAGAYPLDETSLRALGAILSSLAALAAGLRKRPRILLGRDTRESGPEIARQLAAGIGPHVAVLDAGVLPTPGLSFLTRRLGCDFGVMISASHNPFADNGIKIFDRRGEKISSRLESVISREFLAAGHGGRGAAARPDTADIRPYADFLALEGRGLENRPGRLAVDCANGAASLLAPALFQRLGIDAVVAHARPDGRNINAGCGSTQPRALRGLVARSRAGLGLAFDGDADRVAFCDGAGRALDGDHALYLLARYLRDREPRFRPLVVGTVMSNLGLERALQRAGIGFLRADVGDKHVYRLMVRSGALLGGEPSGHVILRHRQRTGDGLLTALYFLRALDHHGWDAAELTRRLPLYPQRTLSLRIGRRRPLAAWPEFQRLQRGFVARHGRRARLLARYSGTEPVIRIMIEARDPEIIETHLPAFRALVEGELGG